MTNGKSNYVPVAVSFQHYLQQEEHDTSVN